MRIRNLKYGIFYRPIDTKMGKQGWWGDIFYDVFTPRRNNKNSMYDNRHAIAANWTHQEVHLGPCATEAELTAKFQPAIDKLNHIQQNPVYEK